MTGEQFLALGYAAFLLWTANLRFDWGHRLRRWFVGRLFYFDPVAARVGPWLRRKRRCMWCARRLNDAERLYYRSSCERCEGINSARWGDLHD
jgi:hypothetical protein